MLLYLFWLPVPLVCSFADQASNRIAFTDKQADLAVKIVLKYERQLAKLGVDVAPANTPAFRIPLRQMDRTSRIWREGDSILARFPYIESQVAAFKEAAKDSQGSVKWDRDLKVWRMALTEYNVNWAYSFGINNNYEIDPSVRELMDLIIACENTKYKIELVVVDDQLEITNAAPELVDYVNNKLGGFELDNLYNLIDYADILGYTIDPSIEEAAIASSSPRMYNLMINKDSKIGASDVERNFADVIQYAPDVSQARVVHFTKYQAKWQHRIPLLLSSAGMLYGGEKQLLIDRAEKVVYFAHDVYNKSSRGARPIAS
jgi:hypothetical protein